MKEDVETPRKGQAIVKKAEIIVLFILCFSGSQLALSSEAEYITIGTFNMRHLGELPDNGRLQRLAKICQDVDLLAIQEVFEEGTAVKTLAEIMGSQYRYAVSDVTTHERFAFIWRYPVMLIESPGFVPGLDLGRDPYSAVFKAGQFDFRIISFHLFWDGSKKTYPHTRGAELKLLDEWICHRKDTELDLILIGDFNEPNMFYRYRFPPPGGFHDDFYRFLLRHGFISVSLEKGIPTSIVNQNIYDHIIFNPSRYFTEEFAGMDRVEVRCWESEYDTNGNGILDYREYEKAAEEVSDHRPVFADFRIDLPDDDE